MEEKFTTRAEVHDKKQFFFWPKSPVKFDYERVIYLLKNASFTKYRFYFILYDNFFGF